MNKPVLTMSGLSCLVWCLAGKELHGSLTPSHMMSNAGGHQELLT